MSWDHKDVYRRWGSNFCVEVSRHTVEVRDSSFCYDSEGPHRWCLYVYVYPLHRDFGRFIEHGQMFDQPSYGMHGGASYFKVNRQHNGDVGSFQIGCDYNHLGDWQYTQMATKEDAYAVFQDADEIFAMLAGESECPE